MDVMERIKLSKNEKRILRELNRGASIKDIREIMHRDIVSGNCYLLETKGLVRCGYIEGGDVEAVALTRFGKDYATLNPTLRNPIKIDWLYVATIAIWVTFICKLIIKLIR